MKENSSGIEIKGNLKVGGKKDAGKIWAQGDSWLLLIENATKLLDTLVDTFDDTF